MLRISVEIPHQSLEIRNLGSGHKSCTAPVVQQRSGQHSTIGRRKLFDDQLSPAQTRLALRGRGYGNEEGILRPVLLGKPQFNRTGIGIES